MKCIIVISLGLSLSFSSIAQTDRINDALDVYHTLAARQFDLISKGDTSEIGDTYWGTHKLKDMYPTAKYGYYTATSKAVIHELKKDLAKNPKDLPAILDFLEVEYEKRFPKLPNSFYIDVRKQINQR